MTTGSSAGFNLAFLAAFDPGDRIALATPGYPAYRNLLGALGLEVVNIETQRRERLCDDAGDAGRGPRREARSPAS